MKDKFNESSFGNVTKSRHSVPKFVSSRFHHTIKKAPQNAKYSVLRGFSMPAAGVEPALNDGVMLSNAKLCQVPCQNKKRAEPKPRRNIVKNVCMP